MKVEYGKGRIYLIPENEKDERQLETTVPYIRDSLLFYTYDAGKEGNEFALVITHNNRWNKK